jgi:Immunity protein 53
MSKQVTDPLVWLERWYEEQWDDEGAHDLGFSIESLDNPGWLVQVNYLLGLNPEAIASDRILTVVGEPPSEENGNNGGAIWMICEIQSGKFIGSGDPTQLSRILSEFRSFVEAHST